jgi:type I restriction enzyme S subunit
MLGNGWTLKRIEELKAPTNGAIAIGPFGSRMKSDCYVTSGVRVIRGTNISDTRSLVGEMVCITPKLADQLGNAIVHADDLVFPHRGSIGLVGIVPRNNVERYALSSSLMKLTCDRKQVEPLYLFYFFRSPDGQHELLKNASTVGTPGIGQPLSSLRSIKVPLPPLAEQQAIVSILGSLDDKIELNRRMNATLEEMARALFQSWFVDFDPVRAKIDGRTPAGLDPATAALFPDSFEDSPLGHIPKGWQSGSILRQANLLSGGTPKTEVLDYWNGEIKWASAKDVSQCGEAFLISTERTITQLGLQQSSTKIISNLATVIVARGATTGRLTMLGKPMAMNQTCYALQSKLEAPFALYCNARHFIERLVRSAHGSIFDTITTNTFEATDVLLAPKDVLVAFDKLVAPFFKQINANLHHSRTLSAARDTLLPKLMRGHFPANVAN